MPEVMKFLDRMDATREERYSHETETKGNLKPLLGFREEWSDYLTDNLDNLYQ